MWSLIHWVAAHSHPDLESSGFSKAPNLLQPVFTHCAKTVSVIILFINIISSGMDYFFFKCYWFLNSSFFFIWIQAEASLKNRTLESYIKISGGHSDRNVGFKMEWILLRWLLSSLPVNMSSSISFLLDKHIVFSPSVNSTDKAKTQKKPFLSQEFVHNFSFFYFLLYFTILGSVSINLESWGLNSDIPTADVSAESACLFVFVYLQTVERRLLVILVPHPVYMPTMSTQTICLTQHILNDFLAPSYLLTASLIIALISFNFLLLFVSDQWGEGDLKLYHTPGSCAPIVTV